MGAQSIRIPVELELKNIQGSINSLRSALSNVSKNSGIYSDLAKEIDKLEKKFLTLQATASRPFFKTSDISSFGNQFLKMGDSISAIAERFKSINFKDLDLSQIEGAQEKLNELQKKVEETRSKAANFMNLEFSNAIASGELKELLAFFNNKAFKVQIDTSSFENSCNLIQTKLQEIIKKKEQLDQKLNTLQAQQATDLTFYQSIKEAEEALKNLKNINDLNKFVSTYDEKAKRISNKMTGEEYLKNYLGIDISSIKQAGADFEQEKNKILASKEFTGKLKTSSGKVAKNVDLMDSVQVQINELKRQYEIAQKAKEEALKFPQTTERQSGFQQAQKDAENAALAFEQYKLSLLESSGVLSSASNATASFSSAMGSLQGQLSQAEARLAALNEQSRKMDQMKSRIAMWFGFTRIMSTVRRVVNNAINEIRELDKVMTEISVVTNMTQKDLWNQIDAYTNIAKQYGVSTRGVYEVSQLYYQQGLQTAEVMQLTTETLKMAKIAGLDYATATDYMTVAIRGFKMEMSDAQQVTDVYSALAAGTASSTEELAVAMSKTASSAEAVGSSFESTSAMIATMIATTREAPENIGSAMKSIISRYGEMTSDPTKMVDSEGEEMSLNRVDKALRSVGITLQDVNGQFRDFDDVILELAKSWDTIDTNTQRYIATIMAGNRQQSRFLALVGNYEEYARALDIAANAEDTGTLQTLKTLDSLETKIQGVKTAWEQFYNSMNLEETFKSVLEVVANIFNNLSNMSKPAAFGTIITLFKGIKTLITGISSGISGVFQKLQSSTSGTIKSLKGQIDTLSEIQKINLDDSDAQSKLNSLLQKLKQLGANIKLNLNGKRQSTSGVTTNPSAPQSTNASAYTGQYAAMQAYAKANPKAFKSFIDGTNFNGKRVNANDVARWMTQNGYYKSNTKARSGEIDRFSGYMQENGLKNAKEVSKHLDSLGKSANGAGKNLDETSQNTQAVARDFSKTIGYLNVFGSTLQVAGAALTTWALTLKDKSSDTFETSKTAAGYGNLLSAVGSGLSTGGSAMMMTRNPYVAVFAAIVSALPGLFSGITQLIDGYSHDTEERLAKLQEELEEKKTEATSKKGEATSLQKSLDNLKKLEEAQYDSAEAAQAYKEAMNAMADEYPNLISHYDSAGNAIIDVAAAEEALTQARYNAAVAARQAQKDEVERNRASIDNYTSAKTELTGEFKASELIGDKGTVSHDGMVSWSYSLFSVEDLANMSSEDIAKNWGIGTGGSFKNLVNSIIDKTGIDLYKLTGRDEINWDSLTNNEIVEISQKIVSVIDSFIKKGEGILLSSLENLAAIDIQSSARNLAITENIDSDKIEENLGWITTIGGKMLNSWAESHKSGKSLDLLMTENIDEYNEAKEQILRLIFNDTKLNFEEISKVYDGADQYSTIENYKEALTNAGVNLTSDLGLALVEHFIDTIGEDKQRIRQGIWESSMDNTTRSNMAALFGETSWGGELLAGYGDSVIEAVKLVDGYAEQGLLAQSNVLKNSISSFYSSLGQQNDSAQLDIFDIVKQIDWTSSESIDNAIKALENYDEAKTDVDLSHEIAALNAAKENLAFNISTEIQLLTDKITSGIENISSLINSQAKGFELEDAYESFKTLTAKEGFESLQFDSIFSYDQELGKWIYSIDGFLTAINAQTEEIDNRLNEIENLKTTFQGFSGHDKIANIEGTIAMVSGKDGQLSAEEYPGLWEALEITDNAAYQSYVLEFINRQNKELTFEEWLTAKAAEIENEYKQLLGISDAYKDNIENMLLAGINFRNLALGNGVEQNQSIIKEAAIQAGKTEEEADQFVRDVMSADSPVAMLQHLEDAFGKGAVSYDDAITLLTAEADTLNSALEKYFEGNLLALSEEEAILIEGRGIIQKNASGKYERVANATQSIQEALNYIADNSSMTLEEISATLFEAYSNEGDRKKQKTQAKLEGKTSFSPEEMGDIAVNIFGDTGFDSDGTLNETMEGIFNYNAEAGEYVIKNFEKYWTEVLNKSLSDADFAIRYGEWLAEQAGKIVSEEDLNQTLTKEAENLIKMQEGGQNFGTIYAQATKGKDQNAINSFTQSLKDLGFEYDASTGLLSEIADTEQDYLGLYKLLKTSELAFQNLTDQEFAQFLSEINNGLIEQGQAITEQNLEAVRNIFATYGTAGESFADLELIKQILGNNYSKFAEALGIASDATQIDLDALRKTPEEVVNALVAGGLNFNTALGIYFDSLMQEAKGYTNSLEEGFKAITSLNVGEQLNLYDYFNEDQVKEIINLLSGHIANGDVSFENGTMEINEGANLPLLMSTLSGLGSETSNSLFRGLISLIPGYSDIVSDSIDNWISKQSERQETDAQAFESALNAQKGTQINLEGVSQSVIDIITSLGATISNGVATFDEAVDLTDLANLNKENLKTFANEQGKTYAQVLAEVDAAANQLIEDKNIGETTAKDQLEKIISGEVGEFSIGSLIARVGNEVFQGVKGISLVGDTLTINKDFDPNAVFDTFIKPLMEALHKTEEEILEASAEAARNSIEKAEKIKTSAASEFDSLLNLEEGFKTEITYLIKVFGNTITTVLSDCGFTVENDIVTAGKNVDIRKLLTQLNLTGKFEEIGLTYAELLESYSAEVDKVISEEFNISETASSELSNLIDADVGDKINVTYLNAALKEIGLSAEAILSGYGITVKDGIAAITKESNILGALKHISQIDAQTNILVDSIGELRDSINNLIQSWISAITDGISGGLSFTDSEMLMERFGLTEADFKETENGLKLSTDAAYNLYLRLKEIAPMQSKLVFDSISESLKEAGSGYEDVASTMETIAKLNKELANVPVSSERRQELERELAIAKEILKVRSNDPGSFNFMDKDLPTGMQGPENYWNSVGEAYKVMNESASSGYMEIQDYVNIINHMSQMVEAAGGEFQIANMNAAQLIEAGMSSLTNIDGEGVKVNLENLGIDILGGTEGMSANFDDAIKEMARGQIEMLDAAIQMLETIVAMEELGNIDVDSDNQIELGEIFKLDENNETIGFTEKYAESLVHVRNALVKAGIDLNQVTIGTHTLNDLLTTSYSEWKTFGITAEQQQKLINSLYQAVLSEDYNPEELASIFQTLASTIGESMTFELGEKIIHLTATGDLVEVDFNSEKNKELLKGKTEEEITQIKQDVLDYFNGKKFEGEQLSTILQLTGQVSIDEKTGKYIVDGKEFDTPEAAQAYITERDFIEFTGTKNVETKDGGILSGTISFSGQEIIVELENGEIVYKSNDYPGITGSSPKELVRNIYESGKAAGEYSDEKTFTEKTGFYLEIEPTATITNPEKLATATNEAVQNLMDALNSGDGETIKNAAKEVGIDVTLTESGEVSATDIAKIKELAGIEDKHLNVAVSTTGDLGVIELLNSPGPVTKQLNVAISQSTGTEGEGTGTGTATMTPQTLPVNIQTTTDGVISENADLGVTTLPDITQKIIVETVKKEGESDGETPEEVTQNYSSSFDIDTSGLDTAVSTIAGAVSSASENITSLAGAIDTLHDKSTEVSNTAGAIDTLHDKSPEVRATAGAIDRLESKTVTASVKVSVSVDEGASVKSRTISLSSSAKGNVALAKGTGRAMVSGSRKTLMGELGPELVVSDGRYFVVGQNGAEFVDLADDAIVFNHLQTQRLLKNGHAGIGRPVTNETKATSLATGNVSGPAMASATEALAQLRQIRAMWQSMLDATAKDLGKKAGGGSGGGGGGGGGGGDEEDLAAYIHDLERWYNLLRQIEKWEQKITFEQARRQNLQSGYDYSKSLQNELRMLKKQQAAYQELADLQRSYYDKRRQDLLSTDYSKIFTYDEDGLMQYVDGHNRGLDILAKLNETNANGKAKMNSQQQIAYLKSLGFDINQFRIKGDGTTLEAKDYGGMMEVFWEGIDTWMEELDGLYDSVNEHLTNVEENQAAQLEIWGEYTENQLSLEERLLTAMTDARQAEIDKLQDNLDALEDASASYIQGLNDALKKEQEMYNQNNEDAETAKLQKQLAILQRSGGSASEIKSLQEQLDARLQESYFNQQQEQIDSIQEAADKQAEKLQQQIDIATESLEYQKENGLFWDEILTMMNNWSVEEIMNYLATFGADLQPISPEDFKQQMAEIKKSIEMYKDFINNVQVDETELEKEAEEIWKNEMTGYSGEYKDYFINAYKNATGTSKERSETAKAITQKEIDRVNFEAKKEEAYTDNLEYYNTGYIAELTNSFSEQIAQWAKVEEIWSKLDQNKRLNAQMDKLTEDETQFLISMGFSSGHGGYTGKQLVSVAQAQQAAIFNQMATNASKLTAYGSASQNYQNALDAEEIAPALYEQINADYGATSEESLLLAKAFDARAKFSDAERTKLVELLNSLKTNTNYENFDLENFASVIGSIANNSNFHKYKTTATTAFNNAYKNLAALALNDENAAKYLYSSSEAGQQSYNSLYGLDEKFWETEEGKILKENLDKNNNGLEPDELAQISPIAVTRESKEEGEKRLYYTNSNLSGRGYQIGSGLPFQITGFLGKNQSYTGDVIRFIYGGATLYAKASSLLTEENWKLMRAQLTALNGGILPKFAKGGLVDFTGPAWVDGTKTKPEAFLSAEDTALLKDKIFSNSNYSLKATVDTIRELVNSFGTITNSSISEGGIVFENVTVEIQPGVISSDYDARRAGEMALEEMVKIARRSTNLNAIRR